MSAPKPLAIVIGSVLLLGGVAAVSAAGPGEMSADNAPADDGVPAAAADQATDTNDQSTAEDAQSGQNDERADRAGNLSVGPSDGLPEQAADNVSEIHEAISSFLDGTTTDLGAALQNIRGGGDETAEDGPANNGDGPSEIDSGATGVSDSVADDGSAGDAVKDDADTDSAR